MVCNCGVCLVVVLVWSIRPTGKDLNLQRSMLLRKGLFILCFHQVDAAREEV